MLILVLLDWRPAGKFNKKKTGPPNTLMVSKSHAVSSRSGAGVFMHCGWICKSASGARRKSARANVIVLAWLPCSTSAAFGHHPWSWSTLWSSDPKWARNTIFSFFGRSNYIIELHSFSTSNDMEQKNPTCSINVTKNMKIWLDEEKGWSRSESIEFLVEGFWKSNLQNEGKLQSCWNGKVLKSNRFIAKTFRGAELHLLQLNLKDGIPLDIKK